MKTALKFLVAVTLVAIGTGTARAGTTYDVALTGVVADFSHTSFDFGGNHYDRFILPLSGLDKANAFTVSVGDTVNSTVTLDQTYSIPTSIAYTNILQILTGSAFPAENTGVSGTFTFYDSGSPVASFTYSSTTANSLASYAANFPPLDNLGFTFNSFTNDALIGTLGTDATLDGSYFFYDLVSPIPAPEPLTLSLFGAGLAGAVALRRPKKTA